MDNDTALATLVPSSSTQLSTALEGLESTLASAARYNVDQAGEGYTIAEKEAMVAIEELRLMNGLDLYTVLLRGKILRQIEERNLWTFHPNRYQTLEAMAQDQSISVSNLSNIRDLNNIIFPWLEQHGFSVAETWENIGMTKFRELLPVMKVLITGEESDTRSVQNSVEAILEDTEDNLRASAVAAGDPDRAISREEIVEATIQSLLVAGEQMTSRALRATVRPVRTEPVSMFILEDANGRRYILAEADEGQVTMLMRRFGTYVEPHSYQLPSSQNERQDFARRIQILQRINGQR